MRNKSIFGLCCAVLFLPVSFQVLAIPATYEQDADQQKTITLAQEGSAKAQLALAVSYALGDGVEKNQEEAVVWYKRAAEQGLAEAQMSLAARYALGQGVVENQQEAIKWYRRAAEQGLPEAQHTLAARYALGFGVDKDEQEAIEWYKKAAKAGLAISQHTLAVHYSLGLGVPKDQKKAIELYKHAASQSLKVAFETLKGMETSTVSNISSDLDKYEQDTTTYKDTDASYGNVDTTDDVSSRTEATTQDLAAITITDTSNDALSDNASSVAIPDISDDSVVSGSVVKDEVPVSKPVPEKAKNKIEPIRAKDIPSTKQHSSGSSYWVYILALLVLAIIPAGFFIWRQRQIPELFIWKTRKAGLFEPGIKPGDSDMSSGYGDDSYSYYDQSTMADAETDNKETYAEDEITEVSNDEDEPKKDDGPKSAFGYW